MMFWYTLVCAQKQIPFNDDTSDTTNRAIESFLADDSFECSLIRTHFSVRLMHDHNWFQDSGGPKKLLVYA